MPKTGNYIIVYYFHIFKELKLFILLRNNISMRRIFITLSAFFLFTFNTSWAGFFKSEEIEVPTDKNIEQSQNQEQSQDQEEFYQLDEEELKQMGYETPAAENDTETEAEVTEAEDNAVSLQANEHSAVPPISDKIFILGVEKMNVYSPVRAENMIWDTSKNFMNSYYQDTKNQSPMPIIMNSSRVSNKVGENTRAYIGQSSLGVLNGLPISFIGVNEALYNNGAKIETNGKYLNISTGFYDSTLNHDLSGGLAASTNSISIPHVKGAFVFGGGFFSNESFGDMKKTGGVFGQYKLDRLKLNLQAAKSKYDNSDGLETSLYFIPEFQLTDSIAVKTRFITNIAQNTNQDEVGLSYKPKRNKRDLELEVNAANYYSDAEISKQRIKFSAKFKI